jgi:hypothetical protein
MFDRNRLELLPHAGHEHIDGSLERAGVFAGGKIRKMIDG